MRGEGGGSTEEGVAGSRRIVLSCCCSWRAAAVFGAWLRGGAAEWFAAAVLAAVLAMACLPGMWLAASGLTVERGLHREQRMECCMLSLFSGAVRFLRCYCCMFARGW